MTSTRPRVKAGGGFRGTTVSPVAARAGGGGGAMARGLGSPSPSLSPSPSRSAAGKQQAFLQLDGSAPTASAAAAAQGGRSGPASVTLGDGFPALPGRRGNFLTASGGGGGGGGGPRRSASTGAAGSAGGGGGAPSTSASPILASIRKQRGAASAPREGDGNEDDASAGAGGPDGGGDDETLLAMDIFEARVEIERLRALLQRERAGGEEARAALGRTEGELLDVKNKAMAAMRNHDRQGAEMLKVRVALEERVEEVEREGEREAAKAKEEVETLRAEVTRLTGELEGEVKRRETAEERVKELDVQLTTYSSVSLGDVRSAVDRATKFEIMLKDQEEEMTRLRDEHLGALRAAAELEEALNTETERVGELASQLDVTVVKLFEAETAAAQATEAAATAAAAAMSMSANAPEPPEAEQPAGGAAAAAPAVATADAACNTDATGDLSAPSAPAATLQPTSSGGDISRSPSTEMLGNRDLVAVRGELDATNARLSALREELAASQASLTTALVANNELRAELAAVAKQPAAQSSASKAEQEDIIRRLEADLASAVAEAREYADGRRRAERQLAKAQDEAEDQIQQLLEETDRLEATVADYEEELARVRAARKASLDGGGEGGAPTEEQIQECLEEIDRLEDELAVMRKKRKEAKKAKHAAQEAMDEMGAEMDSMREELEALRTGDSQDLISSLRDELSEVQASKRQVEKALMAKIDALKAESTVKTKEKDTLSKPFARLIHVDEAMEAAFTCPVCKEMMQEPRMCTPCGHGMCASCLAMTKEQNGGHAICAVCGPEVKVTAALPAGHLEDLIATFDVRREAMDAIRTQIKARVRATNMTAGGFSVN